MVTITVDIDDQVKQHFNDFIEKHGIEVDPSDITQARKEIAGIRAGNSDGYILTQVSNLEAMIAMVEDKTWKIKKENMEKINATIKYFVDEDDVIPDNIPGIGYLDDCIIIDSTMDDVYEELMEFEDFSRTRMVYARDTEFTFEEWNKIKNQEATSRVRNRKLRRSRRR
ncbi:MAG: YkvA family protein [Marinicellaceae bacterium]